MHYTVEYIRHVYYSRTTIPALLMAGDLIAFSRKAPPFLLPLQQERDRAREMGLQRRAEAGKKGGKSPPFAAARDEQKVD